MIRVHEVTHHYGIRPVLTDVSFEIETGQLIALLGPNGSGKTTLLGCMAGTIWPARGYVEFDCVKRRESMDGERELRKRITYLPDDTWLPKHHTGREFLLAVGRLYDIDDFRLFEHADRLMKLFHLEEKGDSEISSYSTGQRKKIALASALITESPYLLLDEPFSGGLDPAGILAMKAVLQKLATDEHVTVVMTTPVPEFIESLADRVAIIRDGALVAYGDTDEIKQVGQSDSFEDALQHLLYPETSDVVSEYFQNQETRR